MTMSATTVHAPSTGEAVAPRTSRHLGWLLIALALVGAAVLTTIVVLDDSGSTDTVVPPSVSGAGSEELGDIRVKTDARQSSLLDRSVSAIDRTVETPLFNEDLLARDRLIAEGRRSEPQQSP